MTTRRRRRQLFNTLVNSFTKENLIVAKRGRGKEEGGGKENYGRTL